MTNVAPAVLPRPALRSTAVAQRLTRLEALTRSARHSLRLWRWVFYTVGLAAVAAAAAAGASSLADLWGSNAAGFLALSAAVLTAVDKFVSASDKMSRLDRRWQSLAALAEETAFTLVDATTCESQLDPTDHAAVAAYDSWLTGRCRAIDAALAAINERGDRV